MEQNPLKIPEVVTVIAENCSNHDLANFRLVSKLWYKESLKVWRSKVNLVVNQENVQNSKNSREIPQFLFPVMENIVATNGPPLLTHGFQTSGKISTEELLQLVNSNTGNSITYPFRRYQLKYWNCMFSTLPTQSLMESTFWSTCGPHMHELNLFRCGFRSISDIESILFEKLPNLRKLALWAYVSTNAVGFNRVEFDQPVFPLDLVNEQHNLKTLHLDVKPESRQLPITWIELLRRFTRLEEIVLRLGFLTGNVNHVQPYESLNEFLYAVKLLRYQNSEDFSLKHLDISRIEGSATKVFPEATVNLLLQLELPLRIFKVDIGYRTEKRLVKSLIEMFASTLETLVLLQAPAAAIPPCQKHGWPFTKTMECLKNLKLIGPICMNFSFLKFTPILRKLQVIDIARSEYRDQWIPSKHDFKGTHDLALATNKVEIMTNVKVPSLLEFQASFRLQHLESVNLLKDWMPNLGVLHMPLSSQNFIDVCNTFKDTLRELKLLQGSIIDDEAILGFAPFIRARSQSSTYWPSNISVLQHLEVFQMEHPHPPNYDKNPCNHLIPRLSQPSILQGFLQLPRLHTLDLYTFSVVEEACLQQLKEKGIKYSVKVVNVCKCRSPA